MKCHKCKSEIMDNIPFEGTILPFIADGERKFLCKLCKYNQPERSKREDHYIGGYFPPPWNVNEYPEKTEGWIAFQEEQRKYPKYYGCGALNSMET